MVLALGVIEILLGSGVFILQGALRTVGSEKKFLRYHYREPDRNSRAIDSERGTARTEQDVSLSGTAGGCLPPTSIDPGKPDLQSRIRDLKQISGEEKFYSNKIVDLHLFDELG